MTDARGRSSEIVIYPSPADEFIQFNWFQPDALCFASDATAMKSCVRNGLLYLAFCSTCCSGGLVEEVDEGFLFGCKKTEIPALLEIKKDGRMNLICKSESCFEHSEVSIL